MSREYLLMLAAFALVILVLIYLVRAERMRRLGEALYEACDQDLQTSYLAVHNCALDRQVMVDAIQDVAHRSPAQIWRANSPPPRDLRIVDRGAPVKFDDDTHPPAAA
jgi:hypothetical protein